MTLNELFTKGGPVVWILGAYSLIGLTIIIERLLRFALMGRSGGDMEAGLAAALRSNESGDLGGWLRGRRGPEIELVSAVLAAAAEGVKDLSRVAIRVGSRQLQAMERGFRTLEILGNTAPLLGLFGTILGMIKAFMVIEQAGGRVDAQALAGGIWEAMVTTGVGLAVSIPILLMLHLLEGMADRRAQTMRGCASVVIEQLGGEVERDEPAVHHREESAGAV